MQEYNELAGASTLYLEATAPATATGLLELAALAANVGLGVAVGGAGDTEVLDGLAGVLAATEEKAVLALRLEHGELVEGEALTTGSDDAGTGALGEAEGADAELGALLHADIVSDGGHGHGNAGLLLVAHEEANAADRHGGAVDAAHVHALEDLLVELGLSAASKEGVQLHEESQVRVLGPRGGAVLVTDIAAAGDKVDTLLLMQTHKR